MKKKENAVQSVGADGQLIMIPPFGYFKDKNTMQSCALPSKKAVRAHWRLTMSAPKKNTPAIPILTPARARTIFT